MLGQASKKRKGPEGSFGFRVPHEPASKPKPNPKQAAHQAENRLLAGYLAHEFLTGGTLFGKPVLPPPAESSKPGASSKPSGKHEPAAKTYDHVTTLLMGGGAHVPGVFNPTQLVQWFKMQ